MENKFNIENVHTVQIDGKDVEVVLKSDVETAVDSYTTEVTTSAEKKAQDTIKRDFSKKLGVNLFDEKAIEVFLKGDGDKVARTEYEALQTKYETLEPFKTKVDELAKENSTLKIDNALIRNSVDDKYKDKVIKLAQVEMQSNNELTPAQAVEKIVQEFDMFKTKKNKWGLSLTDGPDGKTESERYIADKYANNPYYKKD